MKIQWCFVLLAMPLAGCVSAGAGDAANPNTPGGTGRTVIIGNNSTIAGAAQATQIQRLWGELGTSN
ncbi:MAG TPA: hypothetical protein DDZ81_01880 [Acetobacteraceae bacterium]|jgi:hypothetical protein|nr:hypothetical protein [Acetobacteraceae bacterium]